MPETKRTSRYKRMSNRGNVDISNVIKAIKAVSGDDKLSVRAASLTYNVSRTSLGRYIKLLNFLFDDNINDVNDDKLEAALKQHGTYSFCATSKQVFSPEEEEALVGYIKQCSEHYYGLCSIELRKLAYQFAVAREIYYPPTWDDNKMAGRDWYFGFMRRHQYLTLRTTEQTSLNRVKSFSLENVEKFFKNLSAVLTTNNFGAQSIWNMDETGFSTVPTKVGKIISIRGLRRVGQIASAERGTMVTMALAVNAAGGSIPPFFLFPRKNMQTTYMEQASAGSVGFANGSGWMQQSEFVKYMEFFIRCTNASTKSPQLLLLDNHASHLSVEAIDMAVKHGVTLLSFPPHCSHRLQPLDVSVYGPVKTYYKSQCTAWQVRNAGRLIEIRHIPLLVGRTLDYALTPRNIKAEFEATGIAPYNPNIFSESDFVEATMDTQNECTVEETKNMNEDVVHPIIDLEIPEVDAQKKMTNSNEILTSKEQTTSHEPSTSKSETSGLSEMLSKIGPMQAGAPTKKSNRGRRAMSSTILTSPETIASLHEKKEKQAGKIIELQKKSSKKEVDKAPKRKRGRPPKKITETSSPEEDEEFCPKPKSGRGRPPKRTSKKSSYEEDFCSKPKLRRGRTLKETSKKPSHKEDEEIYFNAKDGTENAFKESCSEEDEDFCIICFKKMPRELSNNNSISCIECKRDVHLRCANITRSFFICHNCDSD